MTILVEALVALLIVTGGLFTLTGALGLLRLPDVFARLHGPSTTATLGIGSLAVAAALHFSLVLGELSLDELLVLPFLMLTAPVGAHLIGRTALQMRVRASATPPEDFVRRARTRRGRGRRLVERRRKGEGG